MRYYAVFDTNVLISSLLTKRTDTATAKVVDKISSGDIIPLYNEEILKEYDEVLHLRSNPKRFNGQVWIAEGKKRIDSSEEQPQECAI